jgi:hypothetical protein
VRCFIMLWHWILGIFTRLFKGGLKNPDGLILTRFYGLIFTERHPLLLRFTSLRLTVLIPV